MRSFKVSPVLATFALATAVSVMACGDKTNDAASADSSGKATSTSASAAKSAKAAAPAKTEAPASSLPVKGAWEAVKITYTKDDPKDGSPYFKMENLGGKTVTVCFMDFYGYDEKGKQIAHEQLSWNGEVKGGAFDDSVYTHKHDGVKTWEATYHGIKFEGDADLTMDSKRGPEQRPKGG